MPRERGFPTTRRSLGAAEVPNLQRRGRTSASRAGRVQVAFHLWGWWNDWLKASRGVDSARISDVERETER